MFDQFGRDILIDRNMHERYAIRRNRTR